MNQLEFSKKILSELLVLENQELFEKELIKCLYWLKTDNESYNSLVDWANINLNNYENIISGNVL